MVFVSVENKGAYRCLTAWRAGHSKIMCNSSATATQQTTAFIMQTFCSNIAEEEEDYKLWLTETVNSQLRIQWRPLSAVSKQLYLTLYTCAHEKRFTLILTDSFSCGRQYRSDPDLLARLQINPVGHKLAPKHITGNNATQLVTSWRRRGDC